MQMDTSIEIMPIGYRFLPTDEELIGHYLTNKVFYRPRPTQAIQDIDAEEFYDKHPKTLVEDLNKFEWFFFIHENENENIYCKRKGIRMVGNGTGFWKSAQNEDLVYNSDGDVFAFKIHLTYFSGSPNKAKKTHWKMEEYRLPAKHGDQWVLGRLKRGTDYI